MYCENFKVKVTVKIINIKVHLQAQPSLALSVFLHIMHYTLYITYYISYIIYHILYIIYCAVLPLFDPCSKDNQ